MKQGAKDNKKTNKKTNKKQIEKTKSIKIDLNSINSPADIKSMTEKELDYLSIAIREFLIDSVSKTGGHLASNLGAVELTLGLHYVFDSPKDKFIWDVGHQAYVHKLITGRRDDFHNLRKTGGMSGFPKRNESPHDMYDTGHSSTSISAALGMATARDLNGDDYEVIAIIGDGSMTGGPALEALNNIKEVGTKVIVILNDNGMSISQNIGGISDHLNKLRTSTGYKEAKEKVKETLEQVPVVGMGLRNIISGTKDNIKYMIMPEGILFEEFGLTYIGPFDGNNVKDVITGLNQAKRLDGPVLVHMITEKGKGYKPAEENPDIFHGIGSFDSQTGKPLGKGKQSYSEVFGDALLSVAKDNPRITAITAAMCDATGLGEVQKIFPERVFDVGIAEAYGVIFAAGQALSGLHPFVAIYSTFLQRAYDEILEDVCLQNLPVTFAIDRAGIVGADGETHHGIFDLSYLIPMPGMTIFTPCDAAELRRMVEVSSRMNTPSAIRYPRGTAEDKDLLEGTYLGNLDFNNLSDRLDRWNVRLFKGKDVDILAVGTMLSKAINAREMLKEYDIDVGIISISVVKDGRFPNRTMSDYGLGDLDEAKLIVTLEDNVLAGRFGEMFNGIFNRSFDDSLADTRVINLAWPDAFIEHGSQDELYAKYRLDAEGIANTILEIMN